MKTSTLQSMLARNKGIISNLHLQKVNSLAYIKDVNQEKKDLEGDAFAERYIHNLNRMKQEELKAFYKNQKSLKQLAAIQKAIKDEIRMNDNMDSYLLMLAERD